MSAELSCIRNTLSLLRKVDDTDPEKHQAIAVLEKLMVDKTKTNADKLRIAQEHAARLEKVAKVRTIAREWSELRLEQLDAETGGFSTAFARDFDDMIRNNIDPTRTVKTTSIESRQEFLRHHYLRQLNEIFDAYMTGGLAPRQRDTLNFQRELLGVNTGDAQARSAVMKYRQVYEEMANRLRDNGVFVQTLDHYHTQRLSPGKLAEDKDVALREMAALLDPEQHIDPVGTAEAAYSTLMTRHTLEPGDNPLTMARQLHYRTDDPDRLINFLNKYGEDDVLRQIERQTRQMTRAIAASEVFGPDPGAVIKQAAKRFVRNAPENQRRSIERLMRNGQAAWHQISGTAETPVSTTAANVGSGLRSLVTTSMLGKVVLSILPMDSLIAPFQRATVHGYGKALSLQMEGTTALLNPKIRSAINDHYAAMEPAYFMGSPNSRFSPEPSIEGFARTAQQIGSAFYRLGGAWDAEQGLRGATSYSIGKSLGISHKVPWDELDPRVRQDLASGGVTSKNWDAVNKSGMVDEYGLFMWDKMPLEDATALGAWFHRTLNQSVLRPDATTQAILMMGGRRGTLPGELALTVTHLLNWPMSFARLAMYQQWKKGAPAFAVFGGTMLVASAVTEQLYQITGGRPAYEWDSQHLWGAALARSGLLTPVGDWIWAHATGDTMRQPGLGPVADTAFGTVGSMGRAMRNYIDGESDKAAADIIRAAKRLTPNTFWFEATVLQPAFQSAMETLDPASVARQESRFVREERMGY